MEEREDEASDGDYSLSDIDAIRQASGPKKQKKRSEVASGSDQLGQGRSCPVGSPIV